jgi:hypothetical protein
MDELHSVLIKTKGFTNYLIFSDGRVFNFKTGKFLTPYPNQKGYLRVKLYGNGKSVQIFVHRLVGKIFIPNPHNYEQIHHKDHIKTHNGFKNLKWVTNKENSDYKNNKIDAIYREECDEFLEQLSVCPF